jgi:SAM-dependent methyltransferase
MPTRSRSKRRPRRALDRHLFYTPAVQHVSHDLDALEHIYRLRNRRAPLLLREDFCGTAAAACEFVLRDERRRAWGVDLHRATLEWARRHRLPRLGEAARRLTLVCDDVRHVTRPRVDMVLGLNFSYWVFKTREEMAGYFRAVRGSLRPGGILCLDAFGGTDTGQALVESRRVRASRGPGGERIPPFRYVWEQRDFNPVDHHLRCWIHFHLDDGRKMNRAFTYDWRMWTLPEIRELLVEAGFRDAIVYIQGWDDAAHEALGSYERRLRFENQLSWLAFVIGVA